MDDLNNIFCKYSIDAVYLFGSRARDGEDAKSDYDFGILFNKQVPSSDFAILRFTLIKELIRHLKKSADVIIMNSSAVPLSLKFRIIKEGKIIYEQNSLARGRFETMVLSLYLDRQFYYQRHIAEAIENIAQEGLLD